MNKFEAIDVFRRVVESGSFSAVAKERGVRQPAVSKQITALESHLGAQLLRRTSRTLTLTEAGLEFYKAAAKLLDDLSDAESLVGDRQRSPSGLVRVCVPPVFSRLYLLPRLPAFFDGFPEISVEFIVCEQTPNMVEHGIDLAIHVGDLSDSTAIARKFTTSPVVTVASPAYLAAMGRPERIEDLAGHRSVIFAPRA